MIRVSQHIYFLFSFLILLSFESAHGQLSSDFLKKKDPLLTVNNSGPYLGIQRGKHNSIEFGYEVQKKEIKLLKPNTIAFNIGFDYNLNTNIMGFSLGVWDKPSRIDFTYGASLITKTDFDDYRVGVSPMVGYKISIAHLQLGYNIISSTGNFENTNTLFICIRAVLINHSKYNWRKRKKKE